MSIRPSEIDAALREAYAATATLDEFELMLRIIGNRPEWKPLSLEEFTELVNQRIFELAREGLRANAV
jgi:hypothetical protein